LSWLDLLLGRPLASDEERQQRIGPAAGVPIFGLDALSSAAYGPEAALTVLLPLGVTGLRFALPISLVIIVLLVLVYSSYLQTIAAYPGGGGAYTVAHQNLGAGAGLLAAAALMIDYVLNVAVGISAGVGALISALPSLQPHTLGLCLAILALLAIINLRGVREPGLVFMAPTYVFVACLMVVLVWGGSKALLASAHPHPVVPPPRPPDPREALSVWLLIKAFASGCTAMTGVEAVSNGVQAFREPIVPLARRTLTVIIVMLIGLLAGIAFLVVPWQIGATEPGQAGYESVLSQVTGAVAGKGLFYYVTITSIVLVLCLSANTSFADFPRVCRVVAQDGYLPYWFALRGRRLVYASGMYVLTALSGALLLLFGGVTDRLIPLFAVGAFLAFTLSQAGMVAHWRQSAEPGAGFRQLVNGIGMSGTCLTLGVVLVAKFTAGAWLIVLVIPCLLMLMLAVRRHYRQIAKATLSPTPLELEQVSAPLAVVPIEQWDRTAKNALQLALSLSPEVHVLHIASDEECSTLPKQWHEFAEVPAQQCGLPGPKLVVLQSPYRMVVTPILQYVQELEQQHPDRSIAVVVPELIELRWYYAFLHNQRAKVLKALLLLREHHRIVIVTVPWYLESK
jgi:amino acid transporter